MSSSANTEQYEYWNETAGPKWVVMQTVLDEHLSPPGTAMLDFARLEPGERVIDVGCGCGATSREAARRVAPEGQVLGVDLSQPMLDRAQHLATGEGIGNVRFLQADAQTFEFDSESYDAVVSRFGIMFFEDPVAAFQNLARALKPGGRVVFICWRALQENPWMMIPIAAAAEHVELPPPPDPGEPGPFAFADDTRVHTILERAGLESITLDRYDGKMKLGSGGSLEEAVDFFFHIGPLSRILADASETERENVRQALSVALQPHFRDTGVELPAAAWLVQARKPG